MVNKILMVTKRGMLVCVLGVCLSGGSLRALGAPVADYAAGYAAQLEQFGTVGAYLRNDGTGQSVYEIAVQEEVYVAQKELLLYAGPGLQTGVLAKYLFGVKRK